MVAVLDDVPGGLHQIPELGLTLDQRHRTKILAVEVQDVEGDKCKQLGVPSHARVHGLEVRGPSGSGAIISPSRMKDSAGSFSAAATTGQ